MGAVVVGVVFSCVGCVREFAEIFNSSAAMVDFDLHLSVVSVDNVSPLRGRAAPLQHEVAPYRR